MPAADDVVRVGLISDTHGVLDPRAETVFLSEKVVAIVHAGDVVKPQVLWSLEAIAPVTAVRGNCDYNLGGGWDLDLVARVTIAGVRILVIHNFADLGPIPDHVDVVVTGHSHRPRNEWHGHVLVVNPGSASQRRSMPSRSVGILELRADAVPRMRLVELDDVGPGD